MRTTLRAAWPAALTLAVVLTVLSAGYGWHRDELYFRMLPRAWGYVDQPPFTPWLVRTLAGLVDQPWMVRTAATLAGVVAALLLAGITAALGGDVRAQRVAAWGGAFAGFPVLLGHVSLTSTFDHPVTLAVVLTALLALRRDPRWWLVAGLLAGLSTYNRLLLPVVVLGLVLGLVAFHRTALRSVWLWSGAGLGALLAVPNLVWQARHDWPQLAMGRALSDNNATDTRILLPVVLVAAVGPFLVASVLRGVRVAWQTTDTRWVVVAAALVVVFTFVSGAQPHYPVTMLCVLFAAGCASGRLARRRALVANAVVSCLIGLPVLPVALLARTPIPAMNVVAADQVGWPAYVEQVAQVWDEAGDPSAVVLTGNYGEAGAVDRLGPALGLPPAYSGHNALGLLPPPPEDARTVVVVGHAVRALEGSFDTCRVVRRLDNGVGVDNEEQGVPVSVCRGRTEAWATLWPRLRHLD
ncbi:ArnT family glycosyltransferase [Nocardioides marmoribigeumensis]|uniref:Glycosyltransferase RgtA/B/C/D-like domain-containing protein n=1 Tax=Nocardioides marmoribigeumensis TaxID=433649 RepID=A0ABU2C1H6_9ACTN|nr:glycosyltransferase family 39 protein [Nocardioides marmoribigeumensis]MDR7364496.1 hypothetical protein [Nocardioides marmoribigeumensis]